MDENSAARPYRKRKRAEREEETRRRIVEALVELHGTVGPAKTTVTDVADLAGVSRMTVYNHFPTELDLIAACSSHWVAGNPYPDPAGWAGIADPRERLLAALRALYGWYRRSESMLGNVLRDAPLVAPLGAVMDAGWRPYLEAVVESVLPGWDLRGAGSEDVAASVRLVVDFATWRILTRSGINDDRAARLGVRAVEGVARGADRRSSGRRGRGAERAVRER